MSAADTPFPEQALERLLVLSEALLAAVEQADAEQALALDTQRQQAIDHFVEATRTCGGAQTRIEAARRQLLELDGRILLAATAQRDSTALQSRNARQERTARQAYHRTMSIDIGQSLPSEPERTSR